MASKLVGRNPTDGKMRAEEMVISCTKFKTGVIAVFAKALTTKLPMKWLLKYLLDFDG